MPDFTVYFTVDPDPGGYLPMKGAQFTVSAETPERAIWQAAHKLNPTLRFPATIISASTTCLETGVSAVFNVKRDGLPRAN